MKAGPRSTFPDDEPVPCGELVHHADRRAWKALAFSLVVHLLVISVLYSIQVRTPERRVLVPLDMGLLDLEEKRAAPAATTTPTRSAQPRREVAVAEPKGGEPQRAAPVSSEEPAAREATPARVVEQAVRPVAPQPAEATPIDPPPASATPVGPPQPQTATIEAGGIGLSIAGHPRAEEPGSRGAGERRSGGEGEQGSGGAGGDGNRESRIANRTAGERRSGGAEEKRGSRNAERGTGTEEQGGLGKDGWQKIQRAIDQNKLYPGRAVQMGWEGNVTIEFTITEDRSLRNVRVKASSGRRILDDAALEAVRKTSLRGIIEGRLARPETREIRLIFTLKKENR